MLLSADETCNLAVGLVVPMPTLPSPVQERTGVSVEEFPGAAIVPSAHPPVPAFVVAPIAPYKDPLDVIPYDALSGVFQAYINPVLIWSADKGPVVPMPTLPVLLRNKPVVAELGLLTIMPKVVEFILTIFR